MTRTNLPLAIPWEEMRIWKPHVREQLSAADDVFSPSLDELGDEMKLLVEMLGSVQLEFHVVSDGGAHVVLAKERSTSPQSTEDDNHEGPLSLPFAFALREIRTHLRRRLISIVRAIILV